MNPARKVHCAGLCMFSGFRCAQSSKAFHVGDAGTQRKMQRKHEPQIGHVEDYPRTIEE
jgi:hypothetical protein